MASLQKTGISIEPNTLKLLNEEAQVRGVSRSKLVSLILGQALPRIHGKQIFDLQALPDTSESSWRSKIDLVAHNGEDVKILMEVLSTWLQLLRQIDVNRNALEAEGLPSAEADRQRNMTISGIDSSLKMLFRVALNRLTAPEDRLQTRLFIEGNPFLMERVREIRRKNAQQRQG